MRQPVVLACEKSGARALRLAEPTRSRTSSRDPERLSCERTRDGMNG